MELDASEKLQSLKEILDSNNDRLKQIEAMEREIELSKWLLESFDIMSAEKAEFREIFHREIHSSKKSLHQLEGKYAENKFEIEKKRVMRQNHAILSFIESTFGKKASRDMERKTTPGTAAAESAEDRKEGREERLSEEELGKIVEELEEKEAELERKEIDLHSREVEISRREAEVKRIRAELEKSGSTPIAKTSAVPQARREPLPKKPLKLPPEIKVEATEDMAVAAKHAEPAITGSTMPVPGPAEIELIAAEAPKTEEAHSVPVPAAPHDEEVAVQSFYGASTDYEAESVLDGPEFPDGTFDDDPGNQLPPEIVMVLEMPSETISSIEMPPEETVPALLSLSDTTGVDMPDEAFPGSIMMPTDDLESFIDAVQLPAKHSPEKVTESSPSESREATPQAPEKSREEPKELKLPIQGSAEKPPQKASATPPRRSVEESLKALELLVRKRGESGKAMEEAPKKMEEAPRKKDEEHGKKKKKLSALNTEN